MVAVNHLLRGDALLAGFKGDRNSMLVRAADGNDVLAAHPEVTGIDIRRHVNPCKVPYVYWSVGIRKG